MIRPEQWEQDIQAAMDTVLWKNIGMILPKQRLQILSLNSINLCSSQSCRDNATYPLISVYLWLKICCYWKSICTCLKVCAFLYMCEFFLFWSRLCSLCTNLKKKIQTDLCAAKSRLLPLIAYESHFYFSVHKLEEKVFFASIYSSWVC